MSDLRRQIDEFNSQQKAFGVELKNQGKTLDRQETKLDTILNRMTNLPR